MSTDHPEASDRTATDVVHVEDAADFDRLLSTEDRVLVDFHADWCGPCRMMEPTVEDLAAESDAAVVKVDVDALPQLASRFGVSSIPTFILFVEGEPADRFVGAQDRETLEQAIA